MSLEQAVVQLEQTNAALQEEVVRFRDSAMGFFNIYPTITAGRQAVSDGAYFSVPGNGAYMRLYRRQGSNAELIADYPSRESVVEAINEATTDAEARANAAADRAEVYADNKEFVTHERLRKQATLDLDFASGDYALDDGDKLRTNNSGDVLSVTRATPKWVVGPNGKLREVPPNTIAREWRNGVPEGVLIEESRTNLAIGSSDFSYWSLGGVDSITPGIADGKGAAALSEIIEGTTEGSHEVSQNITVSDGDPIAVSFTWKPTGARSLSVYYVGVDSGGWGGMVHFRSDGSVVGSGMNLVASAYQTQLPNGSFAATIISNPIGGPDVSGRIIFRMFNEDLSSPSYTGDGTSSVLLGEVQVEAASTTSSYIPTTDSPVTRAADNVSRTLGGEINNNAFTIYAEAEQNSDVGSLFYLHREGLSNSIRVGLPTNSGAALYFIADGSTRAVIGLSNFPGYTVGDPARVALSVDTSTGLLTLAINGESVNRNFSGSPALSNLIIGQIAGNNNVIDGTCKSLEVFPRALSEQELIKLTS